MAMYNSHPNIKQEAFKIMSLTCFIWAMNNTSTAYGSHVSWQSTQNEKDLLRISHTSIIQSNNSLGLVHSEDKFFFKSSQSETRISHGEHVRKLYTELSIGASYQTAINLAKWF